MTALRSRLEEYSDASVRRSLVAGLMGAGAWTTRAGITGPSIEAWLDHLWEFVSLRRTFDSWYESRPELVDVSRDRELPAQLQRRLRAVRAPVEDLQRLVSSTTDILYLNLFSSIDWGVVRASLESVESVLSAYELALPPGSLLPPSDRTEAGGWGNPIPPLEANELRRLTPWSWARELRTGRS